MWSEHCSYKSSRIHLKKLPTKSDRVLVGPGENAGIIDIGDGYAIAFKIESHNHPSFIEPFQGAATGVGGIPARHFHHGRAAHRRDGCAALRAAGRSRVGRPQPAHSRRRGRRHFALRQLLRRAHGGRRDGLRILLQRQSAGERVCAGRVPSRRDFFRARHRRGQSGDLCGREDRPRRHQGRVHGVGGVRRRFEGQAPQRAGGRSVHGKTAARSLPGSHAHRRDRRHPGHGRGGPDLFHLRDGQPRGDRHRVRSGNWCRSGKPA